MGQYNQYNTMIMKPQSFRKRNQYIQCQQNYVYSNNYNNLIQPHSKEIFLSKYPKTHPTNYNKNNYKPSTSTMLKQVTMQNNKKQNESISIPSSAIESKPKKHYKNNIKQSNDKSLIKNDDNNNNKYNDNNNGKKGVFDAFNYITDLCNNDGFYVYNDNVSC